MNKKCLVFGHRGAKGYCTENTLESIQKALSIGVNGIEIDVHRCLSGELVVFHDSTLDRMSNATGEISKFSLFELKKIKLDSEFLIPTLEEVLKIIDKKCLLNIELKGKNTARETVRIINKYVESVRWNYSDFLVSSFQNHELETVYKINPEIPLAVLTKANMDEAIEFAQTINAVAIHPNIAIVTNDNIRYAQEKGYKINVWTVNSEKAIHRMKTYKVDGIISDFPDRV